jgi:repressor LexA
MMMVRKTKGLTEKHIKVLEFLSKYHSENGRPPSIREIGDKVHISSTSVVNYYLDQLKKMGYVERDDKISRGLRLTDKVNEIVHVVTDMLRIPVLGPIAAGIPLPELDPNVSYMTDSEANAVDIARSMLPIKENGENLFALEVKGESMIDAMINDGDIVVMKPASEARNGEMVAVWLPNNNEATLKYFFKEKDRYRLQPANPTMKAIYIKKSEPLEIKGKVVMVIRRMDKGLAA